MNKKSPPASRVDEKVYLAMAVLCIVSVIVLAFRFGTSHPCPVIKIQSKAYTFTNGNQISFKAETNAGRTFTWNFGDGSHAEVYTPTAMHKYDNAGKYIVSVTVDGECTEMQNLVITEAPVVTNNSLLPNMLSPDTAYINKPVVFEDISLSSTSWEWHFEDAGTVNAVTRKASHSFLTPGWKKIILKVNGRPDLVSSRLIYIMEIPAQPNIYKPRAETNRPRPTVIMIPEKPSAPPLNNNPASDPKKEEDKPKAPAVSEQQMENMLMQVIEGSKQPEDFSAYLCNNLSLPVFYNGNKTTFSAMCYELKGWKKKKVKSLKTTITKNDNNCILSMNITVAKKKGFLGL